MTAADFIQQSRSRTSTAALEPRGTPVVLIVTINDILYSLYAIWDRGPWSASAAVPPTTFCKNSTCSPWKQAWRACNNWNLFGLNQLNHASNHVSSPCPTTSGFISRSQSGWFAVNMVLALAFLHVYVHPPSPKLTRSAQGRTRTGASLAFTRYNYTLNKFKFSPCIRWEQGSTEQLALLSMWFNEFSYQLTMDMLPANWA